MIANPNITDQDIDWVAKVLSDALPTTITFDDERREVLKHWGTCSVQACPGSGKTTLLIAKILILLDKLPDGTGMCVLSHTNAARDEILKKLGVLGERLSARPHFVGTIQQFVNQFMGIPGAIERFNVRPWGIDDDLFRSYAHRKHSDLQNDTQYWAAQYFIKGKPITRQERMQLSRDNVARYRYSIDDPTQLVKVQQDREYPLNLGPKHEKRLEFNALKEDIAKSGCLAFFDLFALAMEQLNAHPGLSTLISARFPVVFMDEMQDTHAYQLKVLNRAFTEEVMVQRFGDDNQSIYGDSGGSEDQNQGWLVGDALQVSRTKRLSPFIAKVASKLALNGQTIESLREPSEMPHTVFVFESPEDVLPAFARLVAANQQGPWKVRAVGAIGKLHSNPDSFSLRSYFPGFRRKTTTSVLRSSFHAYLLEAHRLVKAERYTLKAFPLLLDGLAQVLRENGERASNNKFFSGARLMRELKVKGAELDSAVRGLLLELLDQSLSSGVPQPRLYADRLLGVLSPLVDEWSDAARAFVLSDVVDQLIPAEDANLYVDAQTGISIQVDTVHGVKGQTHQATLFLETCFSNSFDVPKVLRRLCDDLPRARDQGPRYFHDMKVAFVAFSRPEHLVCAAVHVSRFPGEHEAALEEMGWKVERLFD